MNIFCALAIGTLLVSALGLLIWTGLAVLPQEDKRGGRQ